MRKIYFAYGMNMDREDMSSFCPTAKFLGLGWLEKHRLLYTGGGHADVVPAEGHRVPVVIWEIGSGDEEQLDYREGYPDYYLKQTVSATVTHDSTLAPAEGTVQGMLYRMTEGHGLCLPSRYYEAILRRAYTEFGWDQELLDQAWEASRK